MRQYVTYSCTHPTAGQKLFQFFLGPAQMSLRIIIVVPMQLKHLTSHLPHNTLNEGDVMVSV